MNILETIINRKKTEVKEAKANISLAELQSMPCFGRQTNLLTTNLLKDGATGIIAEFKRASPSKGDININSGISEVIKGYASFGASGISVLTDKDFFKGSVQDLQTARETAPEIPILRKDFMIDEYQIYEAKAYGADIILLIAANLSKAQVRELSQCAKSVDMEVLLEIHNEEELAHICDEVDIVGVNNRDLKSFTVSIERSIELSQKIPDDKIRISESGISSVENIELLKNYGYKGFLIGENFMRETEPTIAFARFVEKLSSTLNS